MCYIKIIAFLQPGIDYMVTSMRFVIVAWVDLVLSSLQRLFFSPVKLATHRTQLSTF